MNYTSVKNPIWANTEHTTINCEVNFDDLKEEFVPFSATANDKYEHTKEIFARAKAGNFGVVAEFTPPLPPTTEELANIERLQRDALLSEVDSIVGNPLRWASFSEAKQQAWANYRQALLDVPQQAGFPNTINWATKPEGAA